MKLRNHLLIAGEWIGTEKALPVINPYASLRRLRPDAVVLSALRRNQGVHSHALFGLFLLSS